MIHDSYLIWSNKTVNKAGPLRILKHCSKPEIYQDPESHGTANEMDVRDRVVGFGSHLGVNVQRADVLRMEAQIRASSYQGERSTCACYLSQVLSFQDTDHQETRDAQVAALHILVPRLAKKLGLRRYVYFIHIDRKHVHAHIISSNFSHTRGCKIAFSLSKRNRPPGAFYFTEMYNLRWAGHDMPWILPGAYVNKSRVPAYIARNKEAKALVEMIAGDPSLGDDRANNCGAELKALIAAGIVTTYTSKKSSTLHFKYNGQCIGTVKGLNHLLRCLGVRYRLNTMLETVPAPEDNSLVTQNMFYDTINGLKNIKTLKDLDAILDMPGDPYEFCKTEEEKEQVAEWYRNGKRPKNARHYKELCNLARCSILRRAFGADKPTNETEPKWAYQEFSQKAFDENIRALAAVLRRDMLETSEAEKRSAQFKFLMQEQGLKVQSVLDQFEKEPEIEKPIKLKEPMDLDKYIDTLIKEKEAKEAPPVDIPNRNKI